MLKYYYQCNFLAVLIRTARKEPFMKDVFKNKKLWIGIGCGVLVIALIVGIILMAGGNGKQPDPTNPSSTTPQQQCD